MNLILASTSAIRRQMLDAAGVEYRSVKPDVDEDMVKAQLRDAGEIASQLAIAKARSIETADWVIGSDSVVEVGERLFSKPRDRDQAVNEAADLFFHMLVALRAAGAEWRDVLTALGSRAH